MLLLLLLQLLLRLFVSLYLHGLPAVGSLLLLHHQYHPCLLLPLLSSSALPPVFRERDPDIISPPFLQLPLHLPSTTGAIVVSGKTVTLLAAGRKANEQQLVQPPIIGWIVVGGQQDVAESPV